MVHEPQEVDKKEIWEREQGNRLKIMDKIKPSQLTDAELLNFMASCKSDVVVKDFIYEHEFIKKIVVCSIDDGLNNKEECPTLTIDANRYYFYDKAFRLFMDSKRQQTMNALNNIMNFEVNSIIEVLEAHGLKMKGWDFVDYDAYLDAKMDADGYICIMFYNRLDDARIYRNSSLNWRDAVAVDIIKVLKSEE